MRGHARDPLLIGVSLKMYFSNAETRQWCVAARRVAQEHPVVASGAAELFVVPGYLSVPETALLLHGYARVGAQDLSTEDAGAYTGEVSGAQLAEAGCSMVEVGHAERRRLFGESDDVVRAKITAALRNGLIPILCIGERERGDSDVAARECIRQLEDALGDARAAGLRCDVVVAYEPMWAIGAAEPAPTDHIRAVSTALRQHLLSAAASGSAVLYGGSAGPGLLTELGDSVDGLFLGRFAHDPEVLTSILDEVRLLRGAVPSD